MASNLVPFLLALMSAGLLAGFLAGLFGIGGGFVVVPALVAVLTFMTDMPAERVMHLAIGTSLATIIVTSLRSLQAHAKHGAVDWQILKSWAPFVVGGVALGIALAGMLDGKALRYVFAIGVLLMSLHFLFPYLSRRLPKGDHMPTGPLRGALGSLLGGFSALLGIGGGTPAVLIMTLSGRSIHQAVATAAGFGTLIAIPGAIGAILIGWHEPNLPAGSLGYVNIFALLGITAMSILTAPLGASLAHSLDQVRLKRVFGLYLVLTSGLMLSSGLLKRAPSPDDFTAPAALAESDGGLPLSSSASKGSR